eukprot:TRINITY_DN17011_c0_g1_i1.p1 TRINITY_DN17011_c0_g1~~TRINITY_DN17011_c0_g1_i1.p1  ORF type:complete len:657 (-),score=40.32 TRINITY_DN17011_c0_g1_i1:430-2400(-)
MAATSEISVAALRRLRHEFQVIQRSQNTQITVRPEDSNFLHWHFALHSLPADTPYANGCYHGRLIFPAGYPHAPPSLLMDTPSGRFATGTRLCLSMTDYHPESWNPAWSVETILVGLISFFVTDGSTLGSVRSSPEERRRYAKESWEFNARDSTFRSLFPELMERHETQAPASECAPSAGATEEGASPDHPSPLLNVDAGLTQDTNDSPVNFMAQSMSTALLNVADAHVDIPLTSSSASHEDDNDEPMECWVCRDTTSPEPLIQPCACRGSMSGVHASCVEEWIMHHRRNAVNSELPRCSVCHQEYRGSEQRPGVGAFLRQSCGSCMTQCIVTMIRLVVFAAWAVGLVASSQKEVGLALPWRICIFVVVALAVVIHVAVLTVSLPGNQLPPNHVFLRRLFIGNRQRLTLCISDWMNAIVVVFMLTLAGVVPWFVGVAIMLPLALPFVKILPFCSPTWMCVRSCLLLPCVVIASPFICVGAACMFIVRNPGRVFHPLGAGPHMWVAVAVFVLAYTPCPKEVIVAIWIVDTAMLLLGVVEFAVKRRLNWRVDALWIFAIYFSAFAAYHVDLLLADVHTTWNICGFTVSVAQTTLFISAVWICFKCAIAVIANRRALEARYRIWQNQHGVFRLNVDAADNPRAEALAPMSSEQPTADAV